MLYKNTQFVIILNNYLRIINSNIMNTIAHDLVFFNVFYLHWS
jgi:hypothetical protein